MMDPTNIPNLPGERVERLQASRQKAASLLDTQRRENMVQYLARFIVDQIDDILQMAYLTGRQDALTELREQTLARIANPLIDKGGQVG